MPARPGSSSGDPDDYPLPARARRVIASGGRCDNPSLALNRLVGPWSRSAGDWLPPKGDQRQAFLREVADALRRERPAWRLLQEATMRWEATLETFVRSGWYVRRLTRALAWRLITGLGSPNPLEVSITLHRIHGYPFIPGSGLKGAVRAYAVDSGQVNELEHDPAFGSQAHAGEVIFFDALPEAPTDGRPLLAVDVINPHFGEYYQGNLPPADYLSPNPVFLLAVAPGTRFRFGLASRDATLADRAADCLAATLSEVGVGGKTRAGYGFFTEDH